MKIPIETLVSILWIYNRSEIAVSCMLILNFWGTAILWSIAAVHSSWIIYSITVCKGSNFSTSLLLLFLFVCFLTIAILMAVRGYLIIVFISISLIISEVGHLFTDIYLSTISILIWRRVYSSPLLKFELACLIFVAEFRSSLNILNVNPLSDMWFANISITECHTFTLLILSYDTQNLTVFMKSDLLPMLLVSCFKKTLLNPVS